MSAEPAQDETIRAFISIHVAPALLDDLEKAQRRLGFDGVRWMRREQIHLTLKFLGDIPASVLGDLEAAVKRACQGVKPLRLTLEGLGCFPNPRHPSVVWVGVGGDLAVLLDLQAAVEKETAVFAEKNENREFHPHLTIGRVKSVPFRELARLGGQIQAAQVGALGEWTAQEVHLMRSELLREGAKHTVLGSVRLE
ncbi:MAG: RNA 2',3'-cyclic phosphodiesterase [Planctomycetota bacterium]